MMGMVGALRMYQAVATLMALSFLSFGLSLTSAFMYVSLQTTTYCIRHQVPIVQARSAPTCKMRAGFALESACLIEATMAVNEGNACIEARSMDARVKEIILGFLTGGGR